MDLGLLVSLLVWSADLVLNPLSLNRTGETQAEFCRRRRGRGAWLSGPTIPRSSRCWLDLVAT